MELISRLVELDREFIAPPDYVPPKKSRKIFLPDPDVTGINYAGLIIGAQGKTQKQLESQTGCKI